MHYIFQKLGIPPDEVMAKPPGVKAFMYASVRVQIETEKRIREGAAANG